MKKLSIITINYNNIDGLRRTFESVRCQTTKDFEYIVVDGGSNDGSKELIETNSDIITKWVSEPDNGIYDAMNKGVKLSTGDYVEFVNSGDMLASSGTIEEILKIPLESDIKFFKVRNLSSDGMSSHVWSPPSEDIISFLYLQSNTLHHPGAVIKREIQVRHPYRSEFRICADRCFFIESLIFDNCTYSTSDVIINFMETQGLSGTSYADEMGNENKRIAELLLPPRLCCDFNKTRWDILQVSQRLIEYQGVTKMICYLSNIILNVIEFIRKTNRHLK